MDHEPMILWALIDHVEGPELPPLECSECWNRARVLRATLSHTVGWGTGFFDVRPFCLIHAKHDRLFRRRVKKLTELRKEHGR